jgi:DNA ligase D-like protein (predicted 3'-phosphoesterase)
LSDGKLKIENNQDKMSLGEYKKKRNFSKTNEPEPKKSDSGGNRFVVQKHDASNLHYDFRLEMEGVLKSWAVPKQPPQKAGIKRLAIMTEDHPLEYINFEGEIPEGQYGAGKVEIWDSGKYEMSEDRKEIEKEELKFNLKGDRLKGEYVLVHPDNFDKNQWLFFKLKDN